MPKPKTPPLKVGTPVEIDIAVAQGVVTAADYDDGWMYRIHVTQGDDCRLHRNEAGELWVCEFEVKPIPEKCTSPQHTIEIFDDLMMVLDEDGNGYDCHILRGYAAAKRKLRRWQTEYSFDYAETLKELDKFFGKKDPA
jgi:hypothetical protein